MYSNKLYTPLRYPGGKARFAPFISQVIAQNNLSGGHYLEPYAGGAGVALELLFHGCVSEVHINDADPAVWAFWNAATRHSRALITLVQECEISIDEWHRWRPIMLGLTPANEIERGFATLFMNRTNRSGILKGGVIGGKQQLGEYRLDARFNRTDLVRRLTRIGEHCDNIHVYGEDALQLLARCGKFLPRKTLLYLDPPYYVKGQGLYRNYYDHDDHAKIARFVQRERFAKSWVVSYDNVSEIREMYAASKSVEYGLRYTAQEKYVGEEIMFFGDRLEVPSTELLLAA